MLDLIVLAADKNMHFALRGALARADAMNIRTIATDYIVHPNRDGGVRKTGPELLSLKRRSASHALLLVDHEGSGSPLAPLALEAELDAKLRPIWGAAAKALVIDPELDVWLWGSDNVLQAILEWPHHERIRAWLSRNGFAFNQHNKPVRPKEALEAIMRELKQPRSSALYEEIAGRISLQRCTDPCFARLREQLCTWFPTATQITRV